jgi:hypothetical protein
MEPVANAEFPIAAADVASLLAALESSVSSLDRETYALDQLVDDVVEPHDDLLAVPVRKHRVHHVLDGCRAELTDVQSGSRRMRTIAVEDENPALVRSTVAELGLWPRPNVSVPRGLARLLGSRVVGRRNELTRSPRLRASPIMIVSDSEEAVRGSFAHVRSIPGCVGAPSPGDVVAQV